MSMLGGTMQGIPLVSLFNNIYMSQIDEKLGAESEFYRRVGDDVIVIDRDLNKLQQSLTYIKSESQIMKIILNQEKTILQPLELLFEYLGLAFEKGLVFIPHSKIQKITAELKVKFKSNSKLSSTAKLSRLRRLLMVNGHGISNVFQSIVNPHNLVHDTKHLQSISLRVMKIIWAYLGGGFTGKKLKQGRKILQSSQLRLQSLFSHFSNRIYQAKED